MEGPIGTDGMSNLSGLPENVCDFLKILLFLDFLASPTSSITIGPDRSLIGPSKILKNVKFFD